MAPAPYRFKMFQLGEKIDIIGYTSSIAQNDITEIERRRMLFTTIFESINLPSMGPVCSFLAQPLLSVSADFRM